MDEKVALLLHMYQPPWQYPKMLKRINKECYNWLTDWIADNNLKVTLNLNYSLTEQLVKNKMHKTIDNIGAAAEEGVLEFTDSAAYHAFLPLLPESEVKRQIELNHKGNYRVFKGVYKPKGFFPPEMAISNKLVKIIKELGYEWTITDNPVYKFNRGTEFTESIGINTLYDLPLLFRSEWSNKFAMEYPDKGSTNTEFFVNMMYEDMIGRSYNILSFDIETIGHHQHYNKESMDWFKKTMDKKGILSKTVTEIVQNQPLRTTLDKKQDYASSWSTTTDDLHYKIPFPLWNNPHNKVHQLQWNLTNAVIEYVENNKDNKNYYLARELLDKGLNSCQYWWADSSRWNDTFVVDGMKNLYSAADEIGYNDKIEKIYDDLMVQILLKK